MLDQQPIETDQTGEVIETSSVGIDTIFKRIDTATYEILEALAQSGKFHASADGKKAIDLELVLLGISNRPFAPEGMKKHINHVYPIQNELATESLAIKNRLRNSNRQRAEQETDARIKDGLKPSSDELLAEIRDQDYGSFNMHLLHKRWRERQIERRMDEMVSGVPFSVKTATQNGLAAPGTEYKMEILDNGIRQFLQHNVIPRDILTSTLHELAMYRAFATLAEKYLPADHVSIRNLRADIDHLTKMTRNHLEYARPHIDDWDTALHYFETVFGSIFESKRAPERTVANVETMQGITANGGKLER